MDPDQRRSVSVDLTENERDVLFSRDVGTVSVDHEVSICGRQLRRGNALHQGLVAHPVLDEITSGDHLEVVLLGVDREIRNPRHRSIVVHDLADHRRRSETREKSQIY